MIVTIQELLTITAVSGKHQECLFYGGFFFFSYFSKYSTAGTSSFVGEL
jgi:hypothetical protein